MEENTKKETPQDESHIVTKDKTKIIAILAVALVIVIGIIWYAVTATNKAAQMGQEQAVVTVPSRPPAEETVPTAVPTPEFETIQVVPVVENGALMLSYGPNENGGELKVRYAQNTNPAQQDFMAPEGEGIDPLAPPLEQDPFGNGMGEAFDSLPPLTILINATTQILQPSQDQMMMEQDPLENFMASTDQNTQEITLPELETVLLNSIINGESTTTLEITHRTNFVQPNTFEATRIEVLPEDTSMMP